MSREIKFRIYDTDEKEMFYQEDIDYIDFFTGIVFIREEDGYDYLIDSRSDGKLMQYTGLKDKSGKEIYEGDIVKLIPLNSERLKELGRKWYEHLKVEWGAYSDGEYVTNVETWMIGINPLSEELLDETVEVIGNIYENPELLEGER